MSETRIEGRCQGSSVYFTEGCGRRPSVIRDGKSFCWQHDPERLRRIATERWEARKKELADMEARTDRRIERRKLEIESGVDSLTNDDLRSIAALGGIRSMIEKLGQSPERKG